MLAPEIAPGNWDVLLSPWHLDEKIEAFPAIGGAAPITRPSYPGSSELPGLIDRRRDIADAAGRSNRPLLLSSDCLAALDMVTGLQRRYSDLTVVWLDAHGDFNTPAISTSGYLAACHWEWSPGVPRRSSPDRWACDRCPMSVRC